MESAVNRLESAVAVRSKESKDAAGRSAAELAAAREEISRLKSDHQSITQKLDATIDRIRAVLGD